MYVCMQRQEHRTMFKNQSNNITKNKELKEQTSLILIVARVLQLETTTNRCNYPPVTAHVCHFHALFPNIWWQCHQNSSLIWFGGNHDKGPDCHSVLYNKALLGITHHFFGVNPFFQWAKPELTEQRRRRIAPIPPTIANFTLCNSTPPPQKLGAARECPFNSYVPKCNEQSQNGEICCTTPSPVHPQHSSAGTMKKWHG